MMLFIHTFIVIILFYLIIIFWLFGVLVLRELWNFTYFLLLTLIIA